MEPETKSDCRFMIEDIDLGCDCRVVYPVQMLDPIPSMRAWMKNGSWQRVNLAKQSRNT